GSGFDLGIAVAILSAAGVVPATRLEKMIFLGELGLDGRVRPVPGVLPASAAAVAAGFQGIVVPPENAPEAALVPEWQVLSAPTLGALLSWLRGEQPPGDAAGQVARLVSADAPGSPGTPPPSASGTELGGGAPGAASASGAGRGDGQERDLADVV